MQSDFHPLPGPRQGRLQRPHSLRKGASSTRSTRPSVIPAQAGLQRWNLGQAAIPALDPRLRGDDME